MKATDYRMIAFEGDLDDITRKFNAWASGDDGIEIVNVQFVPLTFDTYANRHGVIVFYKKKVYKVEKLMSGKCKPVAERPMPKELISNKSAEELETLKAIQRNMAEISHAIEFGSCCRCWSGIQGLNRNIATLMNTLGWKKDGTTTVEYVGDGNTTWRTETKEDKNDRNN